MKKVLLIHNIISPHTESVFQELAKLVNLEVLYCAKKESNREWQINPKGYSHSILKSIKIEFNHKDLFTLIFNPQIINKIKTSNPNVVVISGWDLPTYWIAALYCYLNNIPYVLWSGSTINETSWRRTISKPLVKLIIAGASKYLAYGLKARDYLITLGANSKLIKVVYNSINLNHFKSSGNENQKKELIKKYNLKNKKVILFYGQLVERKNPTLLLRSFKSLKNKNLVLLIVGSGQRKEHLNKLILEERIKNAYVINDPGDNEILAYYDVADIFVLPSKQEVWGLVVNQAMAKGLAVVVSDNVGCTRDLIVHKKTGMIFPSGNEKRLTESLTTLIENKNLLKNIGVNAKAYVQKTSPDRVAKRIADFINQNENKKHKSFLKTFEFTTLSDDCDLTVVQNSDLPFNIKRIYYIYKSKSDFPRGFHAHINNKQILIVLKGSITMTMDNGITKENIVLSKPNVGIFIDQMIWHEMHDITEDAIMLILASEEYDASDYIRDYDDFLERAQKNED